MSETATNPVASNLAPSTAGTVYLSPSNALELLRVVRLLEQHCPLTYDGETELRPGLLYAIRVTSEAVNSIRALLTAIDLDAPPAPAPCHLFTKAAQAERDGNRDLLIGVETRAGRTLTMVEDEVPEGCPFELGAEVSEECFAWLVGHFSQLGQLEGGAL